MLLMNCNVVVSPEQTEAEEFVAWLSKNGRHWSMLTSRVEDYRFQSYFRELVRQRGPAKEIRLFGFTDALIARFRPVVPQQRSAWTSIAALWSPAP